MFKMGCSMARRIIDGKSSASGSAGDNVAAASPDNNNNNSGSSSKKSKKEQNNNNNTTAATKEEINDFSKLEEDPRLPLNVRQIFKITKSWKAIARTMSKTGTAMFLNLFEQNQDLFYLFERFQHLKGKQELHESMELREHAATVMSTLDQSINSLSDYDNFVTYLHSIGKLHRKVPGFKREHFWKIEQPFLKAVKQTLDERCNETIEEIYRIAIKLIIETISEGYGEDRPDVGGALEAAGADDGDRDGDNTGGSDHKNSESGRGGDKSSGGQSSDGRQANNGGESGHGKLHGSGGGNGKQQTSSSNMSSAEGKAAIAAVAATSKGQQQRDTITGHPGENNQHKRDDKCTSLPGSQLAESVKEAVLTSECRKTTIVAAGKQDTGSGRCPVAQPYQTGSSNQGQIKLPAADTDQCHNLHSDWTTTTTKKKNDEGQDQKYNSDDSYGYNSLLQKNDETRELPEHRLKTTIICLRELLALAVKGDSEEAEPKTIDSNGCEERSKDICSRQGDKNNSGSNNEDTKSPETQSGGAGAAFSETGRQPNERASLIGCLRANKRNGSYAREQKPKGGVGRGRGMFGRILFVLVNRRRQFNELARGSREKNATLADERRQREKAVYLIESGLVGSCGVVRRKKASCADVAANAAAVSDRQLASLSGGLVDSASYRSASRRAELMITSPRLADATIAADNTLHRLSHCVGRQANSNDSEREEQIPRSIVRDSTRETNRHDEQDDFTRDSSRQLTTLLLGSIDELRADDEFGLEDNGGGAKDRYSTTRPCNESNSPNQKLADNNASQPTVEPAIVALVATGAEATASNASDMLGPLRHPGDRQHNNEQQRNNLEGNETGKISAACYEDVIRQIATNDHGKVQPLSTSPTLSSQTRRLRIGNNNNNDNNNNNNNNNNNKQSSRAMKWLTGISSGGIVTLLSRAGRKFDNARLGRYASGTSTITTDTAATRVANAAAAADKDGAKVNENEDLVLRVNVSGTTTATDSMECNHHSRSSPMGSSKIYNNSASSNNNINSCGQFVVERKGTQQCAQCPCSDDDSGPTITTTPLSTMAIAKRRADKQAHNPAKANKLASSIRLTSNEGDLGELIKMLMLTLLTTKTRANNNYYNNHQQLPAAWA